MLERNVNRKADMIEKLNNREKQYIILLVIFSGLIMLVGLVYCITHLPVPTMIAVGGLMIYSLIIVLIKPKTPLGKRVHEIFATPVGFILYQMQAVAPSIGILSAYLFSGVMCAVPALCVYYP